MAPLLLLLVFGTFDFGRGMSANVTVTNSAREGARYLTVTAAQQGRDPVTHQYPWVGCPVTTTTPPTDPPIDTAQGRAWRQAKSANLDLTKVVMKVYLYSSSLNHDPATTAKTAADDVFTCTASGSVVETLNTVGYSPQSGDWAQFEADYTYAPLTPVIGQMFQTISMSQTATMVIE